MTPFLLLLLSLNGLWMVCEDGEPSKGMELPEPGSKECAEICLMRAKAAGATCFLLAGDHSITTFSLGFALLPETVSLRFTPGISESTTTAARSYQTPWLENLTPPPKA